MSKKILDYVSCVILGLVLFAAMVAVLLTFSWVPILWSEPAAAWVQAVGSVGAIGVAIWVSYDQHQKQEARERDRENSEVNSMLCSLRDEISMLWELFERRVGKHLVADPDGTEFLMLWPIQERPFTVYDSCVDRIGKIKDHRIRGKIIVTYANAFGLVASFRGNNGLIQQFEEVNALAHRTNTENDVEVVARLLMRLQTYGDGLRQSRIEVGTMVSDLLAHLPTHDKDQ